MTLRELHELGRRDHVAGYEAAGRPEFVGIVTEGVFGGPLGDPTMPFRLAKTRDVPPLVIEGEDGCDFAELCIVAPGFNDAR
jgi:hypothetical protein